MQDAPYCPESTTMASVIKHGITQAVDIKSSVGSWVEKTIVLTRAYQPLIICQW
jgi:SRSO17 transposase